MGALQANSTLESLETQERDDVLRALVCVACQTFSPKYRPDTRALSFASAVVAHSLGSESQRWE